MLVYINASPITYCTKLMLAPGIILTDLPGSDLVYWIVEHLSTLRPVSHFPGVLANLYVSRV